MEALSVSTLVVLLAEIGDKTQLLALLLAIRYRKPWIITLAIFLATILNHALAAWIGNWISGLFSEETLRWLGGCVLLCCSGMDSDSGQDG